MVKPIFSGLLRFSGRRTRGSYLAVLISIGVAFFLITAFAIPPATDPPEIGLVLQTLVLMLCWVVGLFAGSQRFRDIGWSGWFGLTFLVPIIGWLISIALLFVPGTRGPNRYGPDPLESAEAATVTAS